VTSQYTRVDLTYAGFDLFHDGLLPVIDITGATWYMEGWKNRFPNP
jgi:hypothetical protein